MSLKHKITANLTGHTYNALVNWFMQPVYVRFMGAEAYGLVGFFVLLHVWFLLLNLGLTPFVLRKLSRLRASALIRLKVSEQVRTLEWVWGSLGLAVAFMMVPKADWLALKWIKSRQLAQSDDMRFLMPGHFNCSSANLYFELSR